MYDYCCFGSDWELDDAESFTDDLFNKFLNLIFENADSFSLIDSRWCDANNKELELALEPFLIKEYKAYKWFGYGYLGAPGEEDKYQMTIHLYKANDITKQILFDHVDDIFLQKLENGTLTDKKYTLEDINFFKNNILLLGTVSHEYIATLFNTDNVFDEILKEIGNWKYNENDEVISIVDYLK